MRAPSPSPAPRPRSLPALALLLLSLLCPGALPAQPAPSFPDALLAAAVTTTDASGGTWAYLQWTSNAPELVFARTWSIWRKDGAASAPGSYQRLSLVTLQTDPRAIEALADRARAVAGEDLAALNGALAQLFAELVPAPALGLGERASGIFRGALADAARLRTLLVVARSSPTLSLALGQAWLAPVPAAGPVTFEVREHLPLTGTDGAVMARLTVDAATPAPLPAPTLVRQAAPFAGGSGKDNLNVRLLWDYPPALRQVGLLAQGFNVYRVRRADAEGLVWHTTPPTALMLRTLAATAGSGVSRVNRNPVIPARQLTAAEVAAVTDPELVFALDAERALPGFGQAGFVRPRNGDQFWYFVTVRDLLGRDVASTVSPGLLGTFCDRLPPPTPAGLAVAIHYVLEGATQRQRFRLSWRGNAVTEEGKKTTAYAVYRWARANDPHRFAADPNVSLVDLVPAVEGQATYEWIDAVSPASPALPAPAGAPPPFLGDYWADRTVWYTIRAVDDGQVSTPGAPGGAGPFCAAPPFAGNLSGNSPPVAGALRDRVGPPAPAGSVSGWCAVPSIAAVEDLGQDSSGQPPPAFHVFAVTGRREVQDPLLDSLVLEYQRPDGTWASLGRTVFGNDGEFRRTIRLPRSLGFGATTSLRARARLQSGAESGLRTLAVKTPAASEIARLRFTAGIEYGRNLTRGDCDVPPPPLPLVPAGEVPGFVALHTPTVAVRQWKAFARINDGPLVQVAEDSGTFTPGQQLAIQLGNPPPVGGRICYFLQYFDLHGNPSPLTRLDCIDAKPLTIGGLGAPLLSPLRAEGTAVEPRTRLRWFAPRAGVEKFEVWLARLPQSNPASPDPAFLRPSPGQPGFVTVTLEGPPPLAGELNFSVFETPRLGPQFGGDGSPSFELLVPAEPGVAWVVKVRAVGMGGATGPFSNHAWAYWKEPPAPDAGPNVAWPARPPPDLGAIGIFGTATDGGVNLRPEWLPDVAPDIDPGQPGDQTLPLVGLRLGQLPDRPLTRQVAPGGSPRGMAQLTTGLPAGQALENHLFAGALADGQSRSALPFVLYRVQLPTPDTVNALFPQVPGDIVQVSPLLENIAVGPGTVAGSLALYDPYFELLAGGPAPVGRPVYLYVVDTQPVQAGARYLYLLALFDPDTKEPVVVIPTSAIDIPLN